MKLEFSIISIKLIFPILLGPFQPLLGKYIEQVLHLYLVTLLLIKPN